MKYLIYAFIVWTMTGCDIEGAIDNASQRCEYATQRCEDEIAKIIQSIEHSCLTKDELFDIIDSVRAKNDHEAGCNTDAQEES